MIILPHSHILLPLFILWFVFISWSPWLRTTIKTSGDGRALTRQSRWTLYPVTRSKIWRTASSGRMISASQEKWVKICYEGCDIVFMIFVLYDLLSDCITCYSCFPVLVGPNLVEKAASQILQGHSPSRKSLCSRRPQTKGICYNCIQKLGLHNAHVWWWH